MASRCEATNGEGLQCGLYDGHTGRHERVTQDGRRHLWPWSGFTISRDRAEDLDPWEPLHDA